MNAHRLRRLVRRGRAVLRRAARAVLDRSSRWACRWAARSRCASPSCGPTRSPALVVVNASLGTDRKDARARAAAEPRRPVVPRDRAATSRSRASPSWRTTGCRSRPFASLQAAWPVVARRPVADHLPGARLPQPRRPRRAAGERPHAARRAWPAARSRSACSRTATTSPRSTTTPRRSSRAAWRSSGRTRPPQRGERDGRPRTLRAPRQRPALRRLGRARRPRPAAVRGAAEQPRERRRAGLRRAGRRRRTPGPAPRSCPTGRCTGSGSTRARPTPPARSSPRRSRTSRRCSPSASRARRPTASCRPSPARRRPGSCGRRCCPTRRDAARAAPPAAAADEPAAERRRRAAPADDTDAVWRQIVADFGKDADGPVPPWPVSEDVEPRRPRLRPTARSARPTTRRAAGAPTRARAGRRRCPTGSSRRPSRTTATTSRRRPRPCRGWRPRKLAAALALLAGLLLMFDPGLLLQPETTGLAHLRRAAHRRRRGRARVAHARHPAGRPRPGRRRGRVDTPATAERRAEGQEHGEQQRGPRDAGPPDGHRRARARAGRRPGLRRRLPDRPARRRPRARRRVVRPHRRCRPPTTSRWPACSCACRRTASTRSTRARRCCARSSATASSPTTSTRRPTSRPSCGSASTWVPVEQPEMDCGLRRRRTAGCAPSRSATCGPGERVVCGAGGVKVVLPRRRPLAPRSSGS